MEHTCCCKKCVILGLCHNLLTKEWAYMCRMEYTPDSVTYKPKIHEVVASGEAPPTAGVCGWRRVTRVDPYSE